MPERRRPIVGPALLAVVTAAFAGLLVWSATHSNLPQFQGKAMAGRLAFFPFAALIVPIGWRIAVRRRGRPLPFPWLTASLVMLPFVIDLAGNATKLYATLDRFDDVVHTVNPVLFVAAVASLLDRADVPRWSVWTMAFGLGCAGHIVWEVIEYILLEGFGSVALHLTLRDTLSDQTWGLLGAAVGASLPLMLRGDGGEVRRRPAAGIGSA